MVPGVHSKFMRESFVRQRIKASYLLGDELLWLTRKLIWNFVLLVSEGGELERLTYYGISPSFRGFPSTFVPP